MGVRSIQKYQKLISLGQPLSLPSDQVCANPVLIKLLNPAWAQFVKFMACGNANQPIVATMQLLAIDILSDQINLPKNLVFRIIFFSSQMDFFPFFKTLH